MALDIHIHLGEPLAKAWGDLKDSTGLPDAKLLHLLISLGESVVRARTDGKRVLVVEVKAHGEIILPGELAAPYAGK